MTFYSTTTNSTTPATDIITFIEAGLTAHAGWTFIEQQSYTQSSAKVSRIWKCLGSQNSGTYDWHLILTRDSAGTGSFWMKMSEGYNASTHAVIRPCHSVASAAVNATDWSIGNGTEYALTVLTGSTGGLMDIQVNITASVDIEHFLTVSKSFIAYSINQSSAPLAGFYVGNFNPAYSSTYNPVIMNGMSNTLGGAFSGATRWPNAAALPSSNAGATSEGLLIPNGYPSGWITTTAVVADTYRGVAEAAPVMVAGVGAASPSNASLIASKGGQRGTMPTGTMVWMTEAGTPRNGDYITISGVDYFRVGWNSTSFPTTGRSNTAVYVAKTSTY